MLDFKPFLDSSNSNLLEWVEIKAKQEIPGPRWGHSSISHNGNMYIFG